MVLCDWVLQRYLFTGRMQGSAGQKSPTADKPYKRLPQSCALPLQDLLQTTLLSSGIGGIELLYRLRREGREQLRCQITTTPVCTSTMALLVSFTHTL